MYITDASTVVIEVTRRCNMCCAHCLRGDAQNVDIMPEYIDKSFEKFRPGTSISSITFTGGEITLNLAAIWYTLEVVKRRNISVDDFYMVTNGKDASKMPEPASVSLAWWVYCHESDYCEEDFCGVAISGDEFHEDIDDDAYSIRSGLKYFREKDKKTDFSDVALINEGRAKALPSTVYRKEEPEDIYLDVTNLGADLLDISGASIYLNAKGDIVVGCDWSYESQDERKATNVAEREDWAADLLEHEYCEVEERCTVC